MDIRILREIVVVGDKYFIVGKVVCIVIERVRNCGCVFSYVLNLFLLKVLFVIWLNCSWF